LNIKYFTQQEREGINQPNNAFVMDFYEIAVETSVSPVVCAYSLGICSHCTPQSDERQQGHMPAIVPSTKLLHNLSRGQIKKKKKEKTTTTNRKAYNKTKKPHNELDLA